MRPYILARFDPGRVQSNHSTKELLVAEENLATIPDDFEFELHDVVHAGTVSVNIITRLKTHNPHL